MFFSLIIKPENKAIAINGETPDQPGSAAKKYLQAVCKATRIAVKRTRRPFIFIIVRLKCQAKIKELTQLTGLIINHCGFLPKPCKQWIYQLRPGKEAGREIPPPRDYQTQALQ